jgi:MFS family permease
MWGHRLAGRALFVASFFCAGVPPYVAMLVGVPVPVLLLVFALSGLSAGAINPMLSTAMYGLTPEAMRARIFGATTAGVAFAMPVGSFVAGVAVAGVGLGRTLLGCSILYAVLTLLPLFGKRWTGLDAARGQAV